MLTNDDQKTGGINLNGLSAFMDKYFVPVAAKIGSEKHLVALRDAFIQTMPVTMAGALATLLNVFFRDLPTAWGWTGFVNAMQGIIAIDALVWTGTLAMMALVFTVSFGYNLTKAYDVDRLGGSIIALASFILSLPSSPLVTFTNGKSENVYGFLSFSYLDGRGLFTAMIFGFISTMVFIFFTKKNFIIKMPESVPPAVSQAFASILPGAAALYVSAFLVWLFQTISKQSVADWITTAIQSPLMHLSQGYGAVLLMTFLMTLLWFFGLHGGNILAPVMQSVWGNALNLNVNAGQLGKPLPYHWVQSSWDAFVWVGGIGGSFFLVIVLLLFSKKSQERTVAKLALGPSFFNINEPIMFGLPIVLNVLYIIPFFLAPCVMATIAYFATAIGFVSPVHIIVPWVTPPFIASFLATGGDWRAPILELVNGIVAFFIWLPFVLASNRVSLDKGKETLSVDSDQNVSQ